MKLGENPFNIVPKKVKRRYIKKRDTVDVVDRGTGEVTPKGYVTEAEVDATRFIKLYETEWMHNVTLTELRLFAYFISKMDYENDSYFDKDKVQKLLGCKKTALYSALAGLTRKGLIRQRSTTSYWVNPNIICKGKRDKI